MNEVANNNGEAGKPRLVCLCGCSGAGKTTFAEKLSDLGIGTVLLREDLTEHLIFRQFLDHQAGWMETQLEFYVRWAQLICSIDVSPGTIVIIDHSIDVHHKVYSRHAYESQLVCEREWQGLCDAYVALRAFTDSRFTTRNIVLEASSEMLVSRLRARKRDLGDGVQSDWISGQVEFFSSWSDSQVGSLKLAESDCTRDLSKNSKLQERIRNYIDIGIEGVEQ